MILVTVDMSDINFAALEHRACWRMIQRKILQLNLFLMRNPTKPFDFPCKAKAPTVTMQVLGF